MENMALVNFVTHARTMQTNLDIECSSMFLSKLQIFFALANVRKAFEDIVLIQQQSQHIKYQ